MKTRILSLILCVFTLVLQAKEPQIGRIDRPGHINITTKSLKQLQKEWEKAPLVPSKCEPYNKIKLECQKRTAIKQLSDSYKMHKNQ